MKRKWRWVSLCEANSGVAILWSGIRKPTKGEDGYFYSVGNDSISICVKHLREAAGLNIKPGECLRVEFTAKVI